MQNIIWIISTLFLLILTFIMLYDAIYKQYLFPIVVIFAIFILVFILSSSSMLNRMLHTKIGNILSIFIIIFFIFGYYKGYIMAQKPPVDYAFIEIILLLIMIIYFIFDFIKGKNRVNSRTKINN